MTSVQKWVRFLKTATLSAFVAGGLAACGGGGGASGTPVNGGGGSGGGTGTAAVSDLSVVLDKATLVNDGSQTLTVTVTALDANRSAIPSAAVSLSVADPNSSVFLSGAAATTDSAGKVTATVSLGSNPALRTVTVNAVSGTITRSVTFNVVASTIPSTTATNLTLQLDKFSVTNAGNETVVSTVTAVDAAGVVLANVPVSFSVNNGANIAIVNSVTDATGKAVANVQIGADKSNRLVTVTATSNTLTRTATFQVTGAKLQASALPTTPNASSTGNKIDYRLSDVNGNSIVGAPISVTAPGLAAGSGTTDVNGAYTFTYTAPATPGAIDVSAVAGGVTTVTTVIVPSNNSTIPAVTATVLTKSLSVNPTVVKVNSAGSSTNRAEVRALFLAANNAPIPNVRVRFDLNGDENSIGGTVSSGSALVYTDSSGTATTSYYPASRASPTGGLTIRACWDIADFAATACPNELLTKLTIVSEALSITIGTNATLGEPESKLTYIQRFVVLVVDAAGNPVSNVEITPSLDLTSYMKGAFAYGTEWTAYHKENNLPVQGQSPPCLNEDIDRNGSIQTGEDKNGNGQLDPRKSDGAISLEGSTKTDSSGTAIIRLEYPKSVATWVNFTVTVSANGVVGPPATYKGTFGALATDFTQASSPAFQFSPYGINYLTTDGAFCSRPD